MGCSPRGRPESDTIERLHLVCIYSSQTPNLFLSPLVAVSLFFMSVILKILFFLNKTLPN